MKSSAPCFSVIESERKRLFENCRLTCVPMGQSSEERTEPGFLAKCSRWRSEFNVYRDPFIRCASKQEWPSAIIFFTHIHANMLYNTHTHILYNTHTLWLPQRQVGSCLGKIKIRFISVPDMSGPVRCDWRKLQGKHRDSSGLVAINPSQVPD